MLIQRKSKAENVALAISFSALYFVLGFAPISPIIGLPGKAITAAAIMTPIMGIILGPYTGTLSAILGGTIGFFAGALSLPSFVSGIFAVLCAGMLSTKRRSFSAFLYFALLFLFGFYPFVGPVWLYPWFMWFQIVGFIILVSPVQFMTLRNLSADNNSKLLLSFFAISLTSTLAGQIAGSLTFEIISWPIFIADTNVWRANWQFLAFLYPLERTIIALGAAFLGASLYKVLRSAKILRTDEQRSKENLDV